MASKDGYDDEEIIIDRQTKKERSYYPFPRRWIVADVPEVEDFVEPEKVGRLFAIDAVKRRKKHFLKNVWIKLSFSFYLLLYFFII
jgi:hypothetical protein